MSRWRLVIDDQALRQIARLGAVERERVRRYIREKVIKSGNPRTHGKPLAGALSGLWRYRVGNYRIICRIQDDVLVVLIIEVAHRSTVYR